MAMNLLTAVQTNPNLSQEFKDNATIVANQAISFAQAELAATPTAPMPNPEPVNEPVLGATPVAPVDKSEITITVSREDKPSEKQPYGNYLLYASVLDKNGRYTKMAPVTVTLPNGTTFDLKTDTRTTAKLNDWKVGFDFAPTALDQSITVTSGNLSKTYQVN